MIKCVLNTVKHDYQLWTEADCNGEFAINNDRAGEYNFYAWVPGFYSNIGENSLLIMEYLEFWREFTKVKRSWISGFGCTGIALSCRW